MSKKAKLKGFGKSLDGLEVNVPFTKQTTRIDKNGRVIHTTIPTQYLKELFNEKEK